MRQPYATPRVPARAPRRCFASSGPPPRWVLSLALLVGAVVTLGGVTAIALRVADVTAGMSVNLPLLLAHACAVLMAIAPLAIGAASLLGGRRLLQRLA